MTRFTLATSSVRKGLAVATLLLVPIASSCGDSPAQVLTKFCAAASSGVDVPAIAASDDATAVKEKISSMAKNLKSLAGKAPKEIKEDVSSVSSAATDISKSLSDSETLSEVVKAMSSLSSQKVDAASERINNFISTNCKASS